MREGCPKPIPVLDSSSSEGIRLKNIIIETERYILKELGFEIFRLTDHAHKYLMSYVKLLRVSKGLAQKAFYYCNDSYKTSLCIHYPPHTIAVGCIYLAVRTLDYPMSKHHWWIIMETSIKHILEICSDIMSLYELPRFSFKEVNETLDKYKKSLDNDDEFIALMDTELHQGEIKSNNIENKEKIRTKLNDKKNSKTPERSKKNGKNSKIKISKSNTF